MALLSPHGKGVMQHGALDFLVLVTRVRLVLCFFFPLFLDALGINNMPTGKDYTMPFERKKNTVEEFKL